MEIPKRNIIEHMDGVFTSKKDKKHSCNAYSHVLKLKAGKSIVTCAHNLQMCVGMDANILCCALFYTLAYRKGVDRVH